MLPQRLDDFQDRRYWDDFYTTHASSSSSSENVKAFEWFCSADDLLHILDIPEGLVLHLGCGNSNLSVELSKRGVTTLNVDYSRVGLEEIASRKEGIARSEFLESDALRLPLRKGVCTSAIDKGLIDAMMTRDDDETKQRCRSLFSEVAHSLQAGSRFYVVSLGQEHILALFADVLEQDHSAWSTVSVTSIQPKKCHSPLQPFLFLFQKTEASQAAEPIEYRFCGDGGQSSVCSWTEVLSNLRKSQDKFRANFEESSLNSFSSLSSLSKASAGPTHKMFTMDVKPDDILSDPEMEAFRAAAMGLAGQARLKNVRFVDSSIEPVGFGIRKLVLQGTLPESVDSSIMVSSNAVATASPGIIDIEDVLDALGALDGVMSVDLVDLQSCIINGSPDDSAAIRGAENNVPSPDQESSEAQESKRDPMPISAIIFDLDGTLLNSTQALNVGIVEGLRAVGVEIDDTSAVERLAGSPLTDYYTKLSGREIKGSGRGEEDSDYGAFVDVFRDAYNTCTVPAFDDVFAGLSALRGAVDALQSSATASKTYVPFAVATTKPTARAVEEVRAAGLDAFFTVIQGTDDGMAPKPAPDVILSACRRLDEDVGREAAGQAPGVNPRFAIYVGDTRRDVDASRAAGNAAAVSVLYAAHGAKTASVLQVAKDDWGATAAVSSISELPALLPMLVECCCEQLQQSDQGVVIDSSRSSENRDEHEKKTASGGDKINVDDNSADANDSVQDDDQAMSNLFRGSDDSDSDDEPEVRVEQIGDAAFELRCAPDDGTATGAAGPLFAYTVWSGSVQVAEHVAAFPDLVRGHRVVELGAAAALPSLVSLHLGCSRALITDYPSEHVLSAVRRNVDANAKTLGGDLETRCEVLGHLWGAVAAEASSSGAELAGSLEPRHRHAFDVALVAECLWKHDEHENLLRSIEAFLRADGRGVIVMSYAHHIPGLEAQDDEFFALAAKAGYIVEHSETREMRYMWNAEKTVPQCLRVLRKAPPSPPLPFVPPAEVGPGELLHNEGTDGTVGAAYQEWLRQRAAAIQAEEDAALRSNAWASAMNRDANGLVLPLTALPGPRAPRHEDHPAFGMRVWPPVAGSGDERKQPESSLLPAWASEAGDSGGRDQEGDDAPDWAVQMKSPTESGASEKADGDAWHCRPTGPSATATTSREKRNGASCSIS